VALICTRHDCNARGDDLTSPHNHGIDPASGLETCLSCGSFLAERSNLAVLVAAERRERGEPEPWEGSWTKAGDAWAIRLWMPDNDHREDDPKEGHKVRITTRSGKVQVVRLGAFLDNDRRSITFAAPERK
jgi:hypothetical protein